MASAVGEVMESDATAEQFKAIGMLATYKFTTHVSSEEVLPIGTAATRSRSRSKVPPSPRRALPAT